MSRRELVHGLIGCLLALACVSSLRAEELSRPQRSLLSSPASEGALIIVGGGPTAPEVYDEFMRLAGGKDAHLVHIPTATSRFESIPNLREYYNEWFDRHPQSVHFLHTRDRNVAQRAEFAAPLAKASGVWIGGGDQNKLTEIYSGTPVVAAIHEVVARGGVVAGTSSGAAIMSDAMICDETYTDLVVGRGFALCPKAVVDPHLSQRGRIERVMRVLDRKRDHIGIGVDEKTALVIQGDRVRVLGKGHVSFFVTDGQTGTITRHRVEVGPSQIAAQFLAPATTPALVLRDAKAN